MPVKPQGTLKRRWNIQRLRVASLLAWAATTLLACWPEPLMGITILDWPLDFWWLSQGALIAFLLIVWAFAIGADRAEVAADEARNP